MPPLAGIRVLAFPATGAVPVATAVLAALGADAVAVREPDARDGGCAPSPDVEHGGDREVPAPGGRTVTLDLAVPAGQDIAARLASVADVVVDGIAAPAPEQLGLARGDLGSRSAGLVHCSLASMALESGETAAAAVDQALSAVVAILAALEARASSGQDQRIEVPSPAAAEGGFVARQTDEVIEDWLECRVAEIERLRLEGAFG